MLTRVVTSPCRMPLDAVLSNIVTNISDINLLKTTQSRVIKMIDGMAAHVDIVHGHRAVSRSVIICRRLSTQIHRASARYKRKHMSNHRPRRIRWPPMAKSRCNYINCNPRLPRVGFVCLYLRLCALAPRVFPIFPALALESAVVASAMAIRCGDQVE